MEKRMEELTVRTDKDNIIISQVNEQQEDHISISPDQADVLTEWLQEAKKELNKQ